MKWSRIAVVVLAVMLALVGVGVGVSVLRHRHAAGASASAVHKSVRKRRSTPARVATAFGDVRIVHVTIPGSVSHFRARRAEIVLPPAARPGARLPVVLLMSGQPGTPADLTVQGRIQDEIATIANRNGGVAPIVVVPDQLGRTRANPMCVDSRLGHSATYVLTDVRDWVLHHLPVRTDRAGWAVGGFSQGGTCAIQFASAHPDLFGALLDVSGQQAPFEHSVASTIATAFGGSARAYAAAAPATQLARHRPIRAMLGEFAVGALDRRYGPVERRMSILARRAGIHTSLWLVPGVRHNWTCARRGLDWGLDRILSRWGLRSP